MQSSMSSGSSGVSIALRAMHTLSSDATLSSCWNGTASITSTPRRAIKSESSPSALSGSASKLSMDTVSK